MPVSISSARQHLLQVACLAATVLFAAPLVAQDRPRLLLLAGAPDGHPPETHEFAAGMRLLQHMLRPYEAEIDVQLINVEDDWPEGPELLAEADAAVLYLTQGARWIVSDDARHQAFVDLMNRGGGVTCLHWATGAKDAEYVQPFLELVGRCHGGPDRQYVKGDYMITPNGQHPVAAGLTPKVVDDEYYYDLKQVEPADGLESVAQVKIEGRDYTVIWTYERPAGGRAFGFTPLHYHRNWRLPEYRHIVLSGVFWTLGRPSPDYGDGLAVIPGTAFDLPGDAPETE